MKLYRLTYELSCDEPYRYLFFYSKNDETASDKSYELHDNYKLGRMRLFGFENNQFFEIY